MYKETLSKLSRFKVSKASGPEYRLCALAIAAILAGGALVDRQIGSRISKVDVWTPDPSVEVDPSPEIFFAPASMNAGSGQNGRFKTSSKGYRSKESCEADAAEQEASPDVWETMCWGLPSTN